MQRDPGVRKRSHETCTAAHDNKQPDSALWPRHCSASKQAALQNKTTGPAQIEINGPTPLQLQVILERRLRLPGLRTRKGAKHTPHGQREELWARTKPGRGSNGAAPVAITAVRQRRLAGQQLLSKVDGDHLGEEAIRALQNRLRTRSQAA